jgi:hypothetical protein
VHVSPILQTFKNRPCFAYVRPISAYLLACLSTSLCEGIQLLLVCARKYYARFAFQGALDRRTTAACIVRSVVVAMWGARVTWASPLVASAALAVLLHLNTLDNDFVWDDRAAVCTPPPSLPLPLPPP